jgi:hypothetical protein
MNPTIVNLTPHTLKFYFDNGTGYLELMKSIESSGMLRADEVKEDLGRVNLDDIGSYWVPVVRKSFGKVDIPMSESEGVIYVVSQITAQALKEQGRTDDIYIVDGAVRQDENTGELSADPHARGRIVGCTGLAQL